MRNSVTTGLTAALAGALMLTGCATYTGQSSDPNDPNRTRNNALIGAGIGAVAGLLSGDSATERRQHALIGAGAGALTGGAVGAYQDRQEAELRRQMAGTGVDVVRQGDNITLNMPGNVTFGFDQSNIQSQFYPVLNNVANTLRQYEQTVIEVAGHTDNVGAAAYNQQLSERRAQAVAQYLSGQGVNQQRIITVGAGMTRPIADNSTDAGRAQNRRVEITLVPIQQ
ncbi:OmpA family protein [Luteimonas yindakuii]|uniref:OmpA family protein n=1 Tax=Luteimonas yindakuii TaxID=2565782 RepID=A0A4Z1R3F9_9GAMM|nr:OmpA family protein [Luteimonas yindakuii]TKS54052.1 OmpA family protein [Luteimonas yindakuii]